MSDRFGAKASSAGSSVRGEPRRSGRHLAARGAFILALGLCLSALSAAPALAGTVTSHPFVSSFAPPASATPDGPFHPGELAINQSTGDIYVPDIANNVIDVFDSEGNFLSLIDGSTAIGGRLSFKDAGGGGTGAIAVDNSSTSTKGRIYVIDNGRVTDSGGEIEPIDVFSPFGSYLFPLAAHSSAGLGLAVDSQGNVSTTAGFSFQLERLDSTGKQLSIIDGDPYRGSGGISFAGEAFDSHDNLYAAVYSGGQVDKFDSEGNFLYALHSTDFGTTGVAVDRTTDDVYVLDEGGSAVSVFSPTGTLLDHFGLGAMGGAEGIAVNEASGKTYVADPQDNRIDVFGPSAGLATPTVAVEAASSIEDTVATLNGTVNPEGLEAPWRFQYRRQKTRVWESTPFQGPLSGNAAEAVSEAITGLSQNTTYEVRLQAVDAETTALATSSVETFTTTGLPQTILTIDPVSSITPTGAHLSGTLDPNGSDAEWHFEYATDDSFEDLWHKVGADQQIPSGSPATPVSADVTGLEPNTHYFIRLVGTNAGGPKASAEVQFTTKAAPPEARTIPAGCLTPTSACLGGFVNPENSPTTYYFEYGTDTGYGSLAPATKDGAAGSDFKSHEFTPDITGLQAGTTYHFRLVAENQGGTSTGFDQNFTTPTVQNEEPPRAIEQVNPPDSGNQNVYMPILAPRPQFNPAVAYGSLKPVSPDGSRAIWTTWAGVPGSSTGGFPLFVAQRTATGWINRNVDPPASEQVGGGELFYYPVAHNRDLTEFVFDATQGVLGGTDPHTLVRVSASGEQQVIAQLPNGRPADQTTAAAAAPDDLSRVYVGEFNVYGGGGPYVEYRDGTSQPVAVDGCSPESSSPDFKVVPDDSSLVVAEVPTGADCTGPEAVFLLDVEDSTATQISPEGQAGPLLDVNGDGTAVFWENESGQVYAWQSGSGAECLTCSFPDAHRVTPISPDHSTFYFSTSEGLQRWRDGQVDFAGHLEIDSRIPLLNRNAGSEDKANDFGLYMSKDGGVVVFRSDVPGLTADNTDGWPQLFRYDFASKSLVCVSCDGGTGPMVGGIRSFQRWAMSADGGTVAFDTTASLVPRDIDGNTTGRFGTGVDVYEWHAGHARLISGGETALPDAQIGINADVVAVSPDGTDVFFTAANITGHEPNSYDNFYDARIGGGFTEPEPPASCSEDACQGPLQAPPDLKTPTSGSFAGAGNEHPAHKRKHRKKHHRQKHAKHRHRTRRAGR